MTVESDCNKNTGEESTLSLILPQTQSEKAHVKKIAKNRKSQFWPNLELTLTLSVGNELIWFNTGNIMVTDALAPCVELELELFYFT